MDKLIDSILKETHLALSKRTRKLLNDFVQHENGYFLSAENYKLYEKHITTDYEDLSDDEKKEFSSAMEGIISLINNFLYMPIDAEKLSDSETISSTNFKMQKLGEFLLNYKKEIITNFIANIQMDNESRMEIGQNASEAYSSLKSKEFNIDYASTEELALINEIFEINNL